MGGARRVVLCVRQRAVRVCFSSHSIGSTKARSIVLPLLEEELDNIGRCCVGNDNEMPMWKWREGDARRLRKMMCAVHFVLGLYVAFYSCLL